MAGQACKSSLIDISITFLNSRPFCHAKTAKEDDDVIMKWNFMLFFHLQSASLTTFNPTLFSSKVV